MSSEWASHRLITSLPGAAFSGVAIVEVVCGLVGAAMLNPVYATTAKDGHPSAVYLLVAGIYLIAMVTML